MSQTPTPTPTPGADQRPSEPPSSPTGAKAPFKPTKLRKVFTLGWLLVARGASDPSMLDLVVDTRRLKTLLCLSYERGQYYRGFRVYGRSWTVLIARMYKDGLTEEKF